MALRGWIFAPWLLLLAVWVSPAAAGDMASSCPVMAEQEMGHGGCPLGAANCCCLKATPRDSRPLVLRHAPSPAPPALVGLVWSAAPAVLVSRPQPLPLARARAPVPLYLATASLLI